jgi:hypothetical protein
MTIAVIREARFDNQKKIKKTVQIKQTKPYGSLKNW